MSDQLQPAEEEMWAEATEKATRVFTSIHRHNAPLKYGGHARATMRKALKAAAPILTAVDKQRIEELEGELAEEKKVGDQLSVARLKAAERAESAKQRLEEATTALVETAKEFEGWAAGNDLAAKKAKDDEVKDFYTTVRDTARNAANHVREILAALETPKQERDTEVRVEEEVADDLEGSKVTDWLRGVWARDIAVEAAMDAQGMGDGEKERYRGDHESIIEAALPALADAIAEKLHTGEKPSFKGGSEEPDHELKCWPPYFEEVRSGRKTFEIRSIEDRDFEVGQTILLREYDASLEHRQPETEGYTGRSCRRRITYILGNGDWHIAAGYLVLALEAVPGEKPSFDQGEGSAAEAEIAQHVEWEGAPTVPEHWPAAIPLYKRVGPAGKVVTAGRYPDALADYERRFYVPADDPRPAPSEDTGAAPELGAQFRDFEKAVRVLLASEQVIDAVAEAECIGELYGHWEPIPSRENMEARQRSRYAQLAKKPGVQESWKSSARDRIHTILAAAFPAPPEATQSSEPSSTAGGLREWLRSDEAAEILAERMYEAARPKPLAPHWDDEYQPPSRELWRNRARLTLGALLDRGAN